MTYRKWQRFVSGSACLFLPLAILPQVNEDGEITTVASWYGPGFHGKKTASGQVFDQNKMTAASKTLPFGTRLKVRNPKNGKTVTVVINDRGPFIKGRGIDLSKEAARRLGIDGIAKVCYSSVPASSPQPADDGDVAAVASKSANKNVIASNARTRAVNGPYLEILEATPLADSPQTQEQVATEPAPQPVQPLQIQPQQATQELLTSQSLPISQTAPNPQAQPIAQVSQTLPTPQALPSAQSQRELSSVIAMRRFVEEQSKMASMRQFVDEKSQLAMMRSSQLIERADVGDFKRSGQRSDFAKNANIVKPKALAPMVTKAQQPASAKKVHQYTAIVRGVIQSKSSRHHILQTAEIGHFSDKQSPYHQISTTKISHSTGSTAPHKMGKPKVSIAALPRKVAAPRVHKISGTRIAKQARSKRNQQHIAYQRNLKRSTQKPQYIAKSGVKEGRMVARTFKKWGSKFVHVYKGLKGLFASL